MKFIYFGNVEYSNKDNLKKIIININNNYKNKIVIYGGNYYSINNEKNEKNEEPKFLSNNLDIIKLFDENLKKKIIFGNYDLLNNINSTKSLTEQINFYKKTNHNFDIINDVKYIKINKTLIIMFDSNMFNINNPSQVFISDTSYKLLFDNYLKENKNKTIKDLIDYQFNSILNIIKKNNNINNIIFITHLPLFKTNSKIELNFYEWINDFYIYINRYKLYWLCSDSNQYEKGLIIIKKNNIELLKITQYIVPNIFAKEKKDINQQYSYLTNITVKSEYTDITNELSIYYNIKDIKLNGIGYLLYDDNFLNGDFNFIDINKININKININKNNLDKEKIEKIEKSEESDPYKIKYLKYKNKLIKLREIKNKYKK